MSHLLFTCPNSTIETEKREICSKLANNTGVVLLFLLLTLNALFYFTLFSTVSFVDFEQVDVN